MIFHIIRATVKPGVTEEALEAAFTQWRKMAETIPSVESYCIGRDIGGEFEYGGVFVIKDVEGYRVFMNHPANRQTDEIGLPLMENLISMDITDDPDPEIAKKIDEVHRTRFENDPGLVELLNSMSSYTGSGI